MTIEFRCPSCQQTLRVPDDSAGKNARCPKCNGIATVPGTGSPAGAPPAGGASSPWDSTDKGKPAPVSPGPFAASPAAGGGAGFGGTSPPLNPYASPQAMPPTPVAAMGGPIVPCVVEVGPILNYAWMVWKANLGLLIGVTLVTMVISYAVLGMFMGIQFALVQNGGEPSPIVDLASNLVGNLLQTFLGIGLAQISLKLARGQQAQFSDLFNGGSRFLPVLGTGILAGVALVVGFLLCIVPGVILMLMYWPFYYLVVDAKCPALDSFSLGSRIANGNWGNAFLLWLVCAGIMIVGVLALCVGVVAAAPLVSVLWATAYLMMSGQLAPYPAAGPYGQPLPPPGTAKW